MELKEYFTDQALFITHELRDNLRSQDRVVTGKTADSINFEVTETKDKTTFTVFASKTLSILQTGRGPTRNSGGTGQVRKSILQWIKNRGIKADIPDESLAFLIARKIHREGFKGTPGLISSVINDNLIDTITDGVADIIYANELENIKAFAVNFNNK
jgi:hypothetical protein